MATSKKLEIMYHNGQPDGIRSVRRQLYENVARRKRLFTLYNRKEKVYGNGK